MNTIEEIIHTPVIDGLTVLKLDTFQDYRGEIWTVYSDEFT